MPTDFKKSTKLDRLRAKSLLALTAHRTTVLLSRLRVLGPNTGRAKLDIFMGQPEKLTNDLSVNLLDTHTEWRRVLDMSTSTRAATATHVDTAGAVGFVSVHPDTLLAVWGICGR